MAKTKYLVGAFLATALIVNGCSSDEEKPATTTETTQKLAGQRLTDDNGIEYTLIDNGDGTETAKYDDGKSVTFKRQEDGSLDYLYGAAGLMAAMAAGYYMFHGFNSSGGTWDASRNRYTVNEPLQRRNDVNPAGGGGKVNSTSNTTATSNTNPTSSSTNKPATSTTSNATSTTNSNSKVNLSKDNATTKPAATTPSNSSAKTGFGTAGARGGSAAS